jgi:ribonucleotide monophosphatase NagD (HAD superfamily)
MCLATLYRELTGRILPYTLYGKPLPVTYQWAEKLIKQQ